MKIALVGNPNSGKSTLYNFLTKTNQKVGNWPGVTVEYKAGSYFMDESIELIDLPGIYSLSPYSPEEIVTREYLLSEHVDLIINIVDATNLERSLYLTSQLKNMDIPIIIALNMSDILKDQIDINKLEILYKSPVISISALKAENIDTLMSKALTYKEVHKLDLFDHKITQHLKNVLSRLNIEKHHHFYAIKLLENDDKIIKQLNIEQSIVDEINEYQKTIEVEYEDEISGVIINQLYDFVTKTRNDVLTKDENESFTSKVDKLVTSKYLAFPILAIVMFCLYYFTISSFGGAITDFIETIVFPEYIYTPIQNLLTNLNVNVILQSLILDGFVSGVGAVITFVPQIMILFFFISILEDIGYMSRIAFILDKIFSKFGLSGTSVIPMIIGSGCSVPAIMATRTIKDEGNRRLTIMLTPFVICSAKLPIFVLLIQTFFPKSPWLLVAMYFLGIFMILVSGLILKNFKAFKSEDSSFIMEMVEYKKPQLKSCIKDSYQNGISFLKNAGTIIFVASGIIWFLSSFTFTLQFTTIENSMLKYIGSFIAPVFKPIGFGSWQASVATMTGFLAKETVVSTFSILANSQNEAMLLNDYLHTILTNAGALSMMVFTIFAAPCSAAVAATRREFKSWKWTFITIGYQTSVAYIIAFIVYNIANIIL